MATGLVSRSQTLESEGYLLLPDCLAPSPLSEPSALIDSVLAEDWQKRANGTPFAIRNAHLKLPKLLEALERAGLVKLAGDLLGGSAHPVSAVVFDKPEGAKWSVPAHQDVIHPLNGEGPAPGFESWSVKDGLPYAKLPDRLLRNMIALRIHCDDCKEDGALQVVPSTHRSHLPSGEVMDLDLSRVPGKRVRYSP